MLTATVLCLFLTIPRVCWLQLCLSSVLLPASACTLHDRLTATLWAVGVRHDVSTICSALLRLAATTSSELCKALIWPL
jgi:hypothetical protein